MKKYFALMGFVLISVDADLRRLMYLPDWASQIMILECELSWAGPDSYRSGRDAAITYDCENNNSDDNAGNFTDSSV